MKNLYDTNFVLGEGQIPSKLMIIGEYPGIDDNKTGRPFSGKIGRTFNALLKQAGITRKEIYVTMAVKQFRPGNTRPSTMDIQNHRKYLIEEIKMVQPDRKSVV